jgi:hypothetical protein
VLKLLTDPTYFGKTPPSWKVMIVFDGYPTGVYLWATLDPVTNVLSPKTDIASIESFKKALREYEESQLKVLATENLALTEIVSRISSVSASQIKAFGGPSYLTDSLNLKKMWSLIQLSHAKANTTTMIETLQSVTNLQQLIGEDYYKYVERADDASRSFKSVFALFVDQPLSTFIDLLMSLSVISGLDKSNNIYDTAIQEVRGMDLSTPPTLPIYPKIIALLTRSYHTRCLLENKPPNLMGLSSTIKPPVVTSPSTINCSKCNCSIPNSIDPKNNKVKHMCKKCYVAHVKAITANKNNNNNPKTDTTAKPETVSKNATSTNFSGKNPKLLAATSIQMSESQKYLMEHGCNNDDDNNNSD